MNRSVETLQGGGNQKKIWLSNNNKTKRQTRLFGNALYYYLFLLLIIETNLRTIVLFRFSTNSWLFFFQCLLPSFYERLQNVAATSAVWFVSKFLLRVHFYFDVLVIFSCSLLLVSGIHVMPFHRRFLQHNK